MWLVYSVIVLLLTITLIAVIDDRLEPRFKLALYYGIGLVLVFMAGFRDIGFDPDSPNYESYFRDANNPWLLGAVEYSFLYICQVFSQFTDDVHWVFLLYAFFGVMTKLHALTKFGKPIMLYLLVYISLYYELHETTQIRTGVLSGMMLYAIYFIAESKRWWAFLLILFGSFIHMSGLALLPLLFLNNKPLDKKWLYLLVAIVPIAYLTPSGIQKMMELCENIPYVGLKLAAYQEQTESGLIQMASVKPFSPFFLLTVAIYYYLLYFRESLQEEDKYFSILIKIMGVGIFLYPTFAFLPVIGERISFMYRIVTIILTADIYYTIRPIHYAKLVVSAIACVYMWYIVSFIYIN